LFEFSDKKKIEHLPWQLGKTNTSSEKVSCLAPILFCYVNVLGFYSARLVVNSGVPQVSNLGPLLFHLFINNIVEIFSLNVLLFADDVKLYSTIRDISDCMRLQSNVDVLYS
jgi:hypothetical protein